MLSKSLLCQWFMLKMPLLFLFLVFILVSQHFILCVKSNNAFSYADYILLT